MPNERIPILQVGPGPVSGPPGPPGFGAPDAPLDGQLYIRSNGQWVVLPSANANEIDVANPAGTNSNTYVMMGIGLQITLATTRGIVICGGQISNSTNNGETDAQLMWGIGTVPVNGDSVPGNANTLGSVVRFKATSGGGAFAPFSRIGLLSNVVIGQTIWVDIALKTVSGTGTVQDVQLIGFDLL